MRFWFGQSRCVPRVRRAVLVTITASLIACASMPAAAAPKSIFDDDWTPSDAPTPKKSSGQSPPVMPVEPTPTQPQTPPPAVTPKPAPPKPAPPKPTPEAPVPPSVPEPVKKLSVPTAEEQAA